MPDRIGCYVNNSHNNSYYKMNELFEFCIKYEKGLMVETVWYPRITIKQLEYYTRKMEKKGYTAKMKSVKKLA